MLIFSQRRNKPPAPTLCYCENHTCPPPEDTHPPHSCNSEGDLRTHTTKLKVWNGSKELQAANSLFNQERDTIIKHALPILSNIPCYQVKSQIQTKQNMIFLSFFFLSENTITKREQNTVPTVGMRFLFSKVIWLVSLKPLKKNYLYPNQAKQCLYICITRHEICGSPNTWYYQITFLAMWGAMLENKLLST